MLIIAFWAHKLLTPVKKSWWIINWTLGDLLYSNFIHLLPSVEFLIDQPFLPRFNYATLSSTITCQSGAYTSKSHMQHSRHDTGPGFFHGASHVNATHGNFNHIGRDQYNNYNNSMNDEMVVCRSSHHINPNITEFCPWYIRKHWHYYLVQCCPSCRCCGVAKSP